MAKKKSAKSLTLSISLKQKFLLLISLTLILMGLVSFNLADLKPSQLAPKEKPTHNKVQIDKQIKISDSLLKPTRQAEIPQQIVIPGVSVDMSIKEAPIVDGYWETSETTASHGLGSAYPGQKGNSVIFAHARQGLFYNLKDVKLDGVVYVLTNKKWHKYKISKITEVFPDQVQVVSQTKDERLTLYTCSGYADEKRLIVVAFPTK